MEVCHYSKSNRCVAEIWAIAPSPHILDLAGTRNEQKIRKRQKTACIAERYWFSAAVPASLG